MILAFTTGIINILTDFLFWLLLCPIENSIQVTEELLPQQQSKKYSKNFGYISFIRKNMNFTYLINTFQLDNIKQMFYKNEQNITLTNRLMNWRDLITPSLRKLELEAEVQDKLVYVNQIGIQTIIDTRSILFHRSYNHQHQQQYYSESPSGSSVHHFMHQLKLQLSHLSGEKRKLFEESWR